ncbi:helix-turn-helix domain-containing protein [Acetobacter persici]|uniref:hypothetical protein n=1 Tax=Acetobacter persici TaxID=1076596 RepID=UPI001BA8C0EF|nr:hypothetical protein [Acetobacter persici]MBS1015184.1 hypothetical protein [Acetobacter persici]
MNSFSKKEAKKLLDGNAFCREMNTAISKVGSAAAFARLHGLKPQTVRDCWDLKSINPDVVAALGFIQVIRYPVSGQTGVFATAKDVQEKLNNFIRQHKTQRIAAGIFGIHETHLSNIQNGLRGFSPVLTILGFGPPAMFYIKRAADHGAS